MECVRCLHVGISWLHPNGKRLKLNINKNILLISFVFDSMFHEEIENLFLVFFDFVIVDFFHNLLFVC